MLTLQMFFALGLAHCLADFVSQTDQMPQGASFDWMMSVTHAMVYTGVLATAVIILGPWVGFAIKPIAWWALINGVIHFCVEAISWYSTSRLWATIDQLVHVLCLFATASYFLL